MKDKDIIKALEDEIRRANYIESYYIDCVEIGVFQNALDLINRQKAENENLKVENQSLRSAANSLKMHYKEAQAEIKGLNAKNMLTVSEKNAFRTSFYNGLKQLKTAKAEAYKEFAEKLENICEEIIAQEWNEKTAPISWSYAYAGFIDDIDNLLKEMVGEEE